MGFHSLKTSYVITSRIRGSVLHLQIRKKFFFMLNQIDTQSAFFRNEGKWFWTSLKKFGKFNREFPNWFLEEKTMEQKFLVRNFGKFAWVYPARLASSPDILPETSFPLATGKFRKFKQESLVERKALSAWSISNTRIWLVPARCCTFALQQPLTDYWLMLFRLKKGFGLQSYTAISTKKFTDWFSRCSRYIRSSTAHWQTTD